LSGLIEVRGARRGQFIICKAAIRHDILDFRVRELGVFFGGGD